MDIQELRDQDIRIRKMVIEIRPGKTCEFSDPFNIQLLRAHICKVAVGPFQPFIFVILLFFQCNLILKETGMNRLFWFSIFRLKLHQ